MSSGPTFARVGVSAREAEVLAALGDHLTNAEIATRLFISIRTVESHVSSLLRKFQVSDRRALAAVAGSVAAAAADGDAQLDAPARSPATASLPASLTSFVGRVAERAALSAALQAHRLVTAVGPGGVGKTRLALSVAAEVAPRYADGTWYADLVPVTDPAMIAPAVAAALGVGEQHARSAEDTVLTWLADRETMLVVDNCEHLLDGVAVLLERLLASCPRLTVLATSRARLLVPFEWVFPVPGLPVEARDGDGPGDAVALFLQRAEATGSVVAAADQPRVAEICRGLDGMALAIELAAARLPSVGLAGLETGLSDRMRLLTGGRRVDDRHRSLRSTLDWSYGLLDAQAQAILRRTSVFATAFATDAATAVLDAWSPVSVDDVANVLAGLADQSLLVARAHPTGTRYRALETVRQYGDRRLHEAGEALAARSRHLRWCLDVAAALAQGAAGLADGWRPAFDESADELRGALGWAAGSTDHRADAHRLATLLADLCFARGLPGESQRRYEQASELAGDDAAASAALRLAAGAAESRHFGNEALRLHRAAADAAIRAGDRPGAARELARTAELHYRAPGLMSTPPPPGEAEVLLAEARTLAGDDETAGAWVLAADAFSHADDDPRAADVTERAIALARDAGAPLAESGALDQLTSIHLSRGELRAALAAVMRRVELLDPLPRTAESGMEIADGLCMAAECAVAAGDLREARALAERVRDLSFHREEGHLATARLIVVTALAGDWTEATELAERFREGWERAGRPRAGNLSRGAYAAATVYGLRGDDDAREAWLDVVRGLATPGRPVSEMHFGEFFDAMLLLHRGRPDEALRLLAAPPEDFRAWHNGMWRPWYAALWVEAAVLAGHPDAATRIDRARPITAENPIAAAVVARAAVLTLDAAGGADGHRDDPGWDAAVAALDAAGCRYQWARTLVLRDGPHRERGAAVLKAMGATATVVPPARG